MNKIKIFFYAFINSFKPSYYKDVIKAKFSFSLKYFAFLHLLLSLVLAFSVLIPLSKLDAKDIANKLSTIYPEELEITVGGDGLSINQELPYVVDLPSSLFDQDSALAEEFPSSFHIATFDSDENIKGISDVLQRNSMLVITESTVYALKDAKTHELRVMQIEPRRETIRFSKDEVDLFKNQILKSSIIKFKLYIPLIILVIFILVFSLMTIGRMITIFFFAIVAHFLAQLFFKAKQLSYKKTFQLMLHSSTLVIIAQEALKKLNLSYLNGWNYFFILLTWTIYLFTQLQDATATKKASTNKKNKK
ncbi:MAG: DUF1189 family protein [Candidatus Woesebacteria bacterium]|jgi:hypothetical protein